MVPASCERLADGGWAPGAGSPRPDLLLSLLRPDAARRSDRQPGRPRHLPASRRLHRGLLDTGPRRDRTGADRAVGIRPGLSTQHRYPPFRCGGEQAASSVAPRWPPRPGSVPSASPPRPMPAPRRCRGSPAAREQADGLGPLLAGQPGLCESRTHSSSFVPECEPGTLVPGASKRSGLDMEVIGELRDRRRIRGCAAVSTRVPRNRIKLSLHLRRIPWRGRGEGRGP